MAPGDLGFEELYEREFPAVFRAAYVVAGDRAVAEDAAQEAFARALARWRRLRREPWVAGWVTTTAINVARRQLRRRPSLERSADRETDAEGVLDLRRAIGELPRRQQQALVLVHLLGFPLKEAARAMGCREGTVKAHVARARAALARSLLPESSPERSHDRKGDPHG